MTFCARSNLSFSLSLSHSLIHTPTPPIIHTQGYPKRKCAVKWSVLQCVAVCLEASGRLHTQRLFANPYTHYLSHTLSLTHTHTLSHTHAHAYTHRATRRGKGHLTRVGFCIHSDLTHSHTQTHTLMHPPLPSHTHTGLPGEEKAFEASGLVHTLRPLRYKPSRPNSTQQGLSYVLVFAPYMHTLVYTCHAVYTHTGIYMSRRTHTHWYIRVCAVYTVCIYSVYIHDAPYIHTLVYACV